LFWWYPKDFTFVCPTELHVFSRFCQNLKRKYNRNCFCDTNEGHHGLVKFQNNGGIEGVTHPILVDVLEIFVSALDNS
jgi:peroxiredoxin (alkyl hydroperoxide reductase subunit C)